MRQTLRIWPIEWWGWGKGHLHVLPNLLLNGVLNAIDSMR
jgi:hypothetical protein